MALLDVKDLSIGFHMPGRDVQVVDKVSFALEQGETLAIVDLIDREHDGTTRENWIVCWLPLRHALSHHGPNRNENQCQHHEPERTSHW